MVRSGVRIRCVHVNVLGDMRFWSDHQGEAKHLSTAGDETYERAEECQSARLAPGRRLQYSQREPYGHTKTGGRTARRSKFPFMLASWTAPKKPSQ